ncbi:hypothetical protein [Polaribacter sp.]|uniref:hypothetical protein n=1 Tax=Polaribacter sp. TaxID=1920175 RepID=UPI003F6BCB80
MDKDKKEILEQIVFCIAENTRTSLINGILSFSDDEVSEKKEFIKLAKASKKQLRIQLNSIFQYYLEN